MTKKVKMKVMTETGYEYVVPETILTQVKDTESDKTLADMLQELTDSINNKNNITGNAATATKLQTTRNIALSGDATGTTSFDGSSNVTIATTLKDSGVSAGTYPKVMVNTKGIVTGGSTLAVADIPNLTLAKITDSGTAASKNVGTASGNVPIVGTDGKLDVSVIPSLAITDTHTVGTQAAMLSLTAQKGDVAVRTDLQRSFILRVEPASALANWQELLTPTDVVTSVAGKTGVVTLSSADVGLGNVANESKATMFNNAALTGTPTAPTAAVGTNTTQLATTAFVKAAVDAKTTITGNAGSATKLATARTIAISGGATGTAISFDGTGNITIPITELDPSTLSAAVAVNKGGTGLVTLTAGQVLVGNGTSAVSFKAIDATTGGTASSTSLITSGAVQAGLALKSNLVSPTFTGTPAAPTAAAGTNTTQLATTAFVTAAVNAKTTITGNAGSATKLATARTIAVSGGATGTATSFDGTGNITIPITALNPANLSTFVPVNKGGTGLATLTAGQVLVGNGTGAVIFRAIDTTTGGTASSTSLITSGAVKAGLDTKVNKSGDTMTGSLTAPSFKTGKFEMVFNTTDGSLDFVYNG